MTKRAGLAMTCGAAIAALILTLVWATAHALALPIPGLGGHAVQRIDLPSALPYDLPPVAGAQDADLPLVMIDPGHGGFDYGARAPGFDEKALVLGLALSLRNRLVADGAVRVALTRSDDSFVSLEERAEAARRLGADLFLSIHADSVAGGDEAAGASIYTLSDRASSAAALRFARRENASDSVNGQSLSGQSDIVSAILVDLSQRRTQDRSERFADLIERAGAGILRFHPQARRSAALEVLRAPDVPSVLFESGYITNPREAERLTSPTGRADFARVMARAIRLYFARERYETERAASAAPAATDTASAPASAIASSGSEP
jgi:N-acetylmuramoyl-L-alanine amidase